MKITKEDRISQKDDPLLSEVELIKEGVNNKQVLAVT
jgi:hypothetical protein